MRGSAHEPADRVVRWIAEGNPVEPSELLSWVHHPDERVVAALIGHRGDPEGFDYDQVGCPGLFDRVVERVTEEMDEAGEM